MLRIFDEKVPSNPYEQNNWQHDPTKSYLAGLRQGYHEGQQSILSQSKPIEWLDEMAKEWVNSHVGNNEDGEIEIFKPFLKFMQEKLGLKEVDQMLYLNADDGYPDQH